MCTAAVIIAGVSLTTFTRGHGIARHSGNQNAGIVHYYSLWGHTAIPSGLHARLCHAFLV